GSRRHWAFGLASLERLDKIECWLAQGDRGSGVVTGRGAEGPSIRSVPQRAGAKRGRASASGLNVRRPCRCSLGLAPRTCRLPQAAAGSTAPGPTCTPPPSPLATRAGGDAVCRSVGWCCGWAAGPGHHRIGVDLRT
ncbi:hypothetical protein THAOC_37754, partial [Thalassiosira oceanica]